MIVGPTGSGKEHLARSIHYARGSDENASLLPLACGALGGELLWSTIRAWLNNEADAPAGRISTLLLNDVDQVPAEVQPALAEFLAAKRVRVQVIGTATRSLDTRGAESTFRHDLACRLSTLVIQLPPLSERVSDLPQLTQALLEAINGAGGKQVAGFTPESLDVLAGYAWPGNCDELTKLVAEAHAHAGGLEIGPRDLPKRLLLAADAALNPQRPTEAIVLEDFLARMERELIERLAAGQGEQKPYRQTVGADSPAIVSPHGTAWPGTARHRTASCALTDALHACSDGQHPVSRLVNAAACQSCHMHLGWGGRRCPGMRPRMSRIENREAKERRWLP